MWAIYFPLQIEAEHTVLSPELLKVTAADNIVINWGTNHVKKDTIVSLMLTIIYLKFGDRFLRARSCIDATESPLFRETWVASERRGNSACMKISVANWLIAWKLEDFGVGVGGDWEKEINLIVCEGAERRRKWEQRQTRWQLYEMLLLRGGILFPVAVIIL